MIRPITIVTMLMAGGSGLYLYQTKHRALLLDREITHTIKQTEVARERITALRAEWALLNEPERLAELNTQHLGLRTLSPSQFVALSDLAARLPAPLPPGSVVLPEPSEEVAAATPEPAAPARMATRANAPATVQPAPAVAAATPLAPIRPLRTARHDDAPARAAPVPGASPPTSIAIASLPASMPAAPAAIAPAVAAPTYVAPTYAAPTFAAPTPRVAIVQPVAARTPIVLSPPRATSGGPMLTQTLSPVAAGTVGESVQRASSLGIAHASALAPPTPYTGR